MIFVIDQNGRFLYAADAPGEAAHWTAAPLPQPCWNPRFKGTRIRETGEWKGQWEHDGEPVPTAADLCARIDNYADQARQTVAGDPLRAVEYERAAGEAQAFKDAGYPEDAVPRTVAAWAITGRTPQEAADSILTEAAQYAEVLYQIRERRLEAKELIKAKLAAGSIDEAKQIADEAIKAIQAAVTGVGNAKG
ncbi:MULTISPECIES: phage tail protein [unclassified Pseudomonas]|uniref:phage tail protein n=1 Tax=unclassified Pseudomonas TaxID=196821 RepID=UPI00211411A2|nr:MULTISPECIES: phage tail protein [unclassified Pseudomonas]